MPITPTNRARAALKARSDATRADRGRELLAEALQLQQSTREHSTDPTSSRRRRQGDVIDLTRRSRRRHRALVLFVSMEALVAVVGVIVLAVVIIRSNAF